MKNSLSIAALNFELGPPTKPRLGKKNIILNYYNNNVLIVITLRII